MSTEPTPERELEAAIISPADTALVAALAEAQGKFPTIAKSHTAKVKAKGGAEYEYSYADLGDVLAAVRPVLSEHGLAIVQRTRPLAGAKTMLLTELLHREGGRLDTEVEIDAPTAAPQQFGASLTYLRRYEVVTLLGIAAEEDLDAQTVEPRDRNGNGSSAPAPAAAWARDANDHRRRELLGILGELGIENRAAAGAIKAAVDKWGLLPDGVVAFVKAVAATHPDVIATRDAARAAAAAEAPDPLPADAGEEPASDGEEPPAEPERELKPDAEHGGMSADDWQDKAVAAEEDKGQGAEAAAEDPPPEPEPPAPGSRKAPDLSGANLDDVNDRDRCERLLKNMGCICREPLAAADLARDKVTVEKIQADELLNDACPIAGHGHPY